MKNDDIEDVFKQSFDNYEPEVGSKVWKNIKVFLKWGGLAFFINALIQKIGLTTLITVVVSLTAVIGGAIVLNNNKDKAASPSVQQTTQVSDTHAVVAETITVEPLMDEKNTAVAVTTEGKENSKTNEHVAKTDESIASIVANITSGTAPLIVDFSNSGKGKSNKWQFSDDNKEVAAPKSIHVFDAAGTYKVLLSSTGASGNTDVDTISIEVTGATPKAITVSPNGDGMNDEFKLNIQKMASISSKIVDKNGNVVYQAETAGEWNGKDLQGSELPAGLYYYSIQAEGLNGKKYDQKGIINLKR
jgi:gliding motility-associated-like protein